jgi:hypothetical protein
MYGWNEEAAQKCFSGAVQEDLYCPHCIQLWWWREKKLNKNGWFIRFRIMQQLLKRYLRRLTNLTGNNRSIQLRRLIAGQFIDMHELEFLHDQQSSFQLIEQLIGRKTEIVLGPVADSRYSTANTVATKLKKLQRITRFIYDERGSQDLYVGWPFVQGQLADATLIRCPLLFFPVDIYEDGRDWKMVLRQDVPVSLNKSFLLAYAHYNERSLPEELYEQNFDEWETDSRIFRTSLYSLLKETPLEINFNQEIFMDKLQPFEQFTKEELEQQSKPGVLKLYPEAVLGIFPQAGSYIVPDYNALLGDGKLQQMEDLFVSRIQREHNFSFPPPAGAAPENIDGQIRNIREESIFAPFPMDGSQEAAIRAIKAGHSLVIQGPPGTGKSQLIANVIADAMAKGRRVLLVSQKKAALDVVHKRLDQKQLMDFVGLVHDFKWDRKKIFAQIARQIDRVQEYKDKNYGLDTIQLERKFLQACRRIEQIEDELHEFKHALYDDRECGISVKDLYLSSSRKEVSVDLRQEFKHYTPVAVEPFLRKLKTFLRLSARLNKPNYPWTERHSFAAFGISDLQKMLDTIREIYPFQQEMSRRLEQELQSTVSYESAEYLLSRRPQVEELLELLQDPAVYVCFRHMTGYKQANMNVGWLLQVEKSLLQCYIGEGPELSLGPDKLGAFQEILRKRMAARSRMLKWLSWRFFSREDVAVRRVMVVNKLKDTGRDMALLEQKIDNRLNLEHNLTQLKEATWLLNVPENYGKLEFQQWFALQKKAIQAVEMFYKVRGLGHYFNVRKLHFDDLKQQVQVLYQLLEEIPLAKEQWRRYLTPVQIEQLLQSESHARHLSETLEEDFDYMVEFDRMQTVLSAEERGLLHKLTNVPGISGEEAVSKLFINSLKLAWINHIESKYPILRRVSTESFQQLEEELRHCVEEKASVSQEMLLMKVREQTYQNLEYNRLNNLLTYRDLRHQVGKKRSIWPIRKLLAQFHEELFSLVPCWMASPEAVSAIFPLAEMFDLVIFDEASQCYVEKGIPALYRGRQIVVSGDRFQLQPNDLYQVRLGQAEEDEEPDMEVDSLLDLAGRHLMELQLKGHYRSRSPELIDFSNRHFYDNTLKMVPEREHINKKEPAISYRKVEGEWKEQMNLPEAEEVVKLVIGLLKEEQEKYQHAGQDGVPWYEPKTIGVLTFNVRQQGLIQDLLETSAQEQKLSLPDTLFVKNIENVQGDERDIIVFSIGYAPDQHGKMSMNFGSLNAAKGENRLNVAISRARDKIYVLSSIWPHQLKTEDSLNEGPRLFKEYLQYALEVSEGRYRVQPYRPVQQNFSNYLKDRLQQLSLESDYVLNEEQPFGDLTVQKNGQYAGIVFTDDAQYYAMPSVKEAHVYRRQELDHKEWRSTFIFSREYWHDPKRLKEKLNRFIHHIS